jgi:hypothetical protein
LRRAEHGLILSVFRLGCRLEQFANFSGNEKRTGDANQVARLGRLPHGLPSIFGGIAVFYRAGDLKSQGVASFFCERT